MTADDDALLDRAAGNLHVLLLQRRDQVERRVVREQRGPEAVDALLGGRDLLAVMPTGAGKSLCYQLPAVAAGGLTNPEIAAHLFISVNTVKTHQRAIYRKLGVDNRTSAVARGRELPEETVQAFRKNWEAMLDALKRAAEERAFATGIFNAGSNVGAIIAPTGVWPAGNGQAHSSDPSASLRASTRVSLKA